MTDSTTPPITLFMSPGACSRVTLNALEEIGLAYETRLVNAMKAETKSAEYLAINPKGKVPALKIGERVLAENAAIIHHLHAQFPGARLLPPSGGKLGSNQALEDLVWCAATLHPMTRMVRMPVHFTVAETAGVVAKGKQFWEPVLRQLEARFGTARWWYGSEWSILDVYLYWAYCVAESGGLDLSPYPSLRRHTQDVSARPSFQRALEREFDEMRKHNLPIPPSWQTPAPSHVAASR